MNIHIKLPSGKITVLDERDYALVPSSLHSSGPGYVAFSADRTEVYLHRFVMENVIGRGLVPGEIVDHIDRNPLNNSRDNLRITDHYGSVCNRAPYVNSTSRYKGVHWRKDISKWQMTITKSRRNVISAVFDSEESAARAYDHYAMMYHGKHAYLNFPNDIKRSSEETERAMKQAKPHKGSASRFIGVYACGDRWAARIRNARKDYFLGLFDTQEEAARAWDAKAVDLRGPSTKVNFP